MAEPQGPLIALVTNCTTYGGPGSASGLVAAGHRVFCHDRSFASPEAREQWSAAHPGAGALAEQDPVALVETVIAKAGRIDAVVSNDVVTADREGFAASTPEQFDTMIADGMVFPYRLAHRALQDMVPRRSGALVFITSAAARMPTAGAVLYSAVRGGTTAMAIALGRAYGKQGIAVNAVGPSWFDNAAYFPEGWAERSPQRAEFFEKHATLDRLGTQDEMGRLVAFLCEQRAMPVTAQYIDFSGNSPP